MYHEALGPNALNYPESWPWIEIKAYNLQRNCLISMLHALGMTMVE